MRNTLAAPVATRNCLLLLLATLGAAFYIFGHSYLHFVAALYLLMAVGIAGREAAFGFPKLSLSTVWRRYSYVQPLIIAAAIALISIPLGAISKTYQCYALVTALLLPIAQLPRFRRCLTELSKRKFSWLLVVAGGAFFLWFAGVILRSVPNIPFWDDYETSIRFFVEHPNQRLSDLIQFLFSQHMEHVAGGTNLILYAVYKTAKGFDARNLAAVGVFFIGCYLWLFCKSARVSGERWIYGLLVLLALLQCQYRQSLFWASNVGGVFLFHCSVLGAFYLAERRNTAALTAAALLAFLATFTFGSGFLVYVLVFALLVYERRYLGACGWCVPMTLALWLYFKTFVNPVPVSTPISDYFVFLLAFLGNFFTMGAYGDSLRPLDSGSLVLSIVCGGALLGGTYCLLKKKYYKLNPSLFLYFIFVITGAFLAAKQRGFLGVSQAFQSRYHLYSALTFTILFIALSEIYPKFTRKIYGYAFLFLVVLNVSSYTFGMTAIRQHTANLIYGEYLAEFRSPLKPVPVLDQDHNEMAYFPTNFSTYKQALSNGVLSIPVETLRGELSAEEIRDPALRETLLKMPGLTEGITIRRTPLFAEVEVPNSLVRSHAYVVVQSEGGARVYVAQRIRERAVSWNLMKYFYGSELNFVAYVPVKESEEGKSTIRVVDLSF